MVLPKSGSKEEQQAAEVLQFFMGVNSSLNDVIFDDRTNSTIGRRLKDIQMAGYPYVAVFGKNLLDSDEPKIEVINRISNETEIMNQQQFAGFLTSLGCF